MKNLKLETVTQGIRGGKNTYRETGFGVLKYSKAGRNEIEITIDTYEGQGASYQEKQDAQIKIIFAQGEHWHGTAAELSQILQNYKPQN